ncbi:MAG: TetR/AcrR family transcriptional regulator [Actinomycetes bacterium]
MAAAPQGRQRQTSARSRQAILDAANGLLRSQPYREVSVESVMAKADLSRTIFYRHFDGMPSVALQLLTDLGGDVIELSSAFAHNALAARSGLDGPNSELIRDSLSQVVRFFTDQGPLVKAVADAAVEDEDLEAGYEGFIRHFSAETGNAIAGLVKAGITDVPDPQATAEALTAMNERYLLRTLGRHPQEDPAVVLNTIHAIWARTLFSESLKV